MLPTEETIQSHPSWVCGLKLLHPYWQAGIQRVTPFVGVWIETGINGGEVIAYVVTPFVGVWIETSNRC